MRYLPLLLLPLLPVSLAAQYGTKPRARAEVYPAHAKLQSLSLGAEYLVHSFSGGGETFIARDYLVVEVALFPAAKDGQQSINAGQFALRVNKHKQPLAPQAPEFVAASLKYPDWETHPQAEASAGPVIFGAPQSTPRFPGDPQAQPLPMPRAPAQNPGGVDRQPPVTADELAVQAALPEGDHRGPVSGYLYFPYHGKIKHIHSLELEFSGAAGHAALELPLTPVL